MLSRLVHGTRISLQAGVLSAFVGASVSMLVGVARAHLGCKTDLIVQRIIDAMMALPPLILAISIMAALGGTDIRSRRGQPKGPHPTWGDVPSPLNPPAGCVFHPRCHRATSECQEAVPDLREVQPGHWTPCIHAPGYWMS